ncbi:MAG: hypothetical protein JNM89_08010 [Hyphomicrobiaceae bacterium]|nr:hypothetical protein [Hyphomicrobiaceae bacterium]
MALTSSSRLAGTFAVLASLLLAGCAGGTSGGDPGAGSLPSGKSCKDVRAELDKLDARGVPSRIEAAGAGKKLPPGQKEEVDRYNALLAQYLGARCHL